MLCPSLELTESGRYIINGYYTTFVSNQGDLDPRISEKNNEKYIVLGGVETDYKLLKDDIITNTSGIVKELSIKGKIFLLMLCLLSAPAMKLLQSIVPWIKKQIAFIQKILSKF